MTTKSTLTVATWCTRPVRRPTSTIAAMTSSDSSIVTSSIGVPSSTAARRTVTGAPPCRARRPSVAVAVARAVRAQPSAPGRTSIRAHSRTFHTTIAGACSSERYTDAGRPGEHEPGRHVHGEGGDEAPALQRALGAADPAPSAVLATAVAARRRDEHRQRRDEVVEHLVDGGDAAAAVAPGRAPTSRGT